MIGRASIQGVRPGDHPSGVLIVASAYRTLSHPPTTF